MSDEVNSLKTELEMAQKSLKLQTKRCRELVEEYTKRLQEKERQYQSERILRDNQLAKVLRALLMFEARLRQEQKLIRDQLDEKDFIISKQKNDMQRLLNNQYCKHCNQIYKLESFNSSSEYLGTDYNDYQSSNVESLDSSCETYATVSDKDYDLKSREMESGDEVVKSETGNYFLKNKNSLNRRKKIGHRKSVGTYFEVLKLRSDINEDYNCTTNNSLSLSSDNAEEIVESSTNLNSSSNMSLSDCNDTVIQKITDLENVSNDNNSTDNSIGFSVEPENLIESSLEESSEKVQKITETIPIFDGDGESNDKWYASVASDQEDEEQNRIYRNNPVLECMNQILLQNMNGVNSPPKTPTMERKAIKGKKVKFRDEEFENVKYENQHAIIIDKQQQQQLLEEQQPPESEQNYYETPVQKTPNFYETPQSIYSNDYEQILNNKEIILPTESPNKLEHHYIDMDTSDEPDENEKKIIRKTKILRIPPALPPKPANLLSKSKLQMLNNMKKPGDEKSIDGSIESEPDYCSISELNLPNKGVVLNKINVVSESNPNNLNAINKTENAIILHKPKIDVPIETYDPIDINECISNLVKKNVEKFNVQLAKQTTIKSENFVNKLAKPRKDTVDIPKLPQVSEIIIPDDCESKKDDRITQDNYIKNNTQVLKSTTRKPIVMGSTVSSLITGFNNRLLSEIKSKDKKDTKMLSNFDNLQNFDKHRINKTKETTTHDNSKFENFDLSQNFEEFKLDECDIGEEYKFDLPDLVTEIIVEDDKSDKKITTTEDDDTEANANSNDSLKTLNTVELIKRKIEMQLCQANQQKKDSKHTAESTYEHFLECTGLSSKSIIAPSKYLKNNKTNSKNKLRFSVNNDNKEKYWSEPFV